MKTRALIGICAATFVIAHDAPAQDALGDGRALDNNLRFGSGGRNSRVSDLQAELQYRNAIVTGNAPGGASFRGSVGYAATEDFRGELGSNDEFAFQRDSLYSGFALQGLRGIDAMMRQNAYATGGFIDPNAPIPIAIRSGASTFGDVVVGTDQARNLPTSMYDPFSLQQGALRSSALGYSTAVLSPRRIAAEQTEEGATKYTVASPLRGLTTQYAPDYPAARFEIPEVPESGPYSPFETEEDEDAAPVERRPGQAPSDRIGGKIEEGPEDDRVTSRISDRVESDRPDYTRALQELRESFAPPAQEESDDESDADVTEAEELISKWAKPADTGIQPTSTAGAELAEEDDEADAEEDETPFEKTLRDLSERISKSRARNNNDDERFSPAEEERDQLMKDAKALIGQKAPRISTLHRNIGDGERTLFDRQMDKAQGLLARHKWFAAEEAFSTALRLRPGDPMAAAGRIHAQIGAGLFKSAATNLEQLLVVNPELISVKFDRQVMVDDERLTNIREALREATRRDSDFGRKSAMVLAYVGWQVGDETDVRHAFRAIDRIDDSLNTQPDPLFDVLRTIWLTD